MLRSGLGAFPHSLGVLVLPALLSAAAGSAEPDPASSVQRRRNGQGMELVTLAAGRFRMGSDEGDWDEQPVHTVILSRPTPIAATAVTLEQYRRFDPAHSCARPDGTVCGVSWHSAMAFCAWLSEEEGVPYRLPTEAEWEYACRAGTDTPFRSGQAPPGPDQPHPWGLSGMGADAPEWCLDWYAPYPAEDVRDPWGAADGHCRVVRGGRLDRVHDHELPARRPPYHLRSANRASMAPDLGVRPYASPPREDTTGLVGVYYGSWNFTRPLEAITVGDLDATWGNSRGADWAARWFGHLVAPVSGPVRFECEAKDGLRLTVDGRVILDTLDDERRTEAEVELDAGQVLPLVLEFSCRQGNARLRVLWSWAGQQAVPVPGSALRPDREAMAAVQDGLPADEPGSHVIGFRVVQAPMPDLARPDPVVPFVRSGVRQTTGDEARTGPPADRPYYRRRPLLPIPPDNASREAIDAAGLHRAFRGHNHSPALEVCPNGDLLLVIYTSWHEYEPGVSLMASRLRFGAEDWDFPSPFMDFADVNDHAPLLWTHDGRMYLFWGCPMLKGRAFPFQWIESEDSGATWGPVRFPTFTAPPGPHSRQPINTVVHLPAAGGDPERILLASDAQGGESVLWLSSDGGRLWSDPGGRTPGRHSTCCRLGDNSILSLGGKNTDIDGYMPQAVSTDNGRTWTVTRSPFPAQGGNQRPCLLRLASGRLFFAADFQLSTGGSAPDPIRERGAFVALSGDEGRTWHIKPLAGAQPHENPALHRGAATLGYSCARQAPDGVIHLITTMNTPCLHFAFNEAWILSDAGAEPEDPTAARPIPQGVRAREERDTDAKLLRQWHAGRDPDSGRYLLHGSEKWYGTDGSLQYETDWDAGHRTGTERLYRPDGTCAWERVHDGTGGVVWTRFHDNGRRRSRSHWQGQVAHGPAETRDRSGNLLTPGVFEHGAWQPSP